MQTSRLIAGALLLCVISLALPRTTASAQADDLATAKPCPIDFGATRVVGDPNAATIAMQSVPERGATIIAYGLTTRWSAAVDRFATGPARPGYKQPEYSFVVRAPGPIEAVLYEPPNGGCLAHSALRDPRDPRGPNRPDVDRPTLALGNAVAMELIACAKRYVPATTIQAAEPETPAGAPLLGVSGVVYVLVTLDARGQPTNAKVMSSPGSILNTPSVEAALHSAFSPEIFRCHSVPGIYVFGVSYGP